MRNPIEGPEGFVREDGRSFISLIDVNFIMIFFGSVKKFNLRATLVSLVSHFYKF